MIEKPIYVKILVCEFHAEEKKYKIIILNYTKFVKKIQKLYCKNYKKN